MADGSAAAEPRCTGDDEDRAPDGAALVRLMTWLSPAFPVGAFTYSHGLEWAIEDGTVTNAASLEAWIGSVLRHGAGRTDAVLLAEAWRATRVRDTLRLTDAADLAFALQPSRERRLEAGAQGKAFVTAVAATWEAPTLSALADDLAPTPVAYAVAVGVAGADHAIPLGALLEAHLTAFVANLVSAAVRAVPLGQTDGQRVIRALTGVVAETAGEARAAAPDDVGGAALRADIASMKHETQYTRLFRS
ncbi:urease accessory protein UreF [Mongoliimonas terrestris]|uniref:urease accessory protein UreF n=1 Tax=Mongoliimonas terrestris TaxID=1709001 RepID=UPI0009499938|nr:urease accessory protein UreF [Mongoliimonas terrestris]